MRSFMGRDSVGWWIALGWLPEDNLTCAVRDTLGTLELLVFEQPVVTKRKARTSKPACLMVC